MNRTSSSWSRWSGIYLVLQGVGGLAWWLGLWASASFLALFVPEGRQPEGLLAFWLADLVFFVGGSWVGAWAVWRGWRHRAAVLWLLAGATGYAALWCVAQTAETGQGWWSTLLMGPAAVVTVAVAVREGRGVLER